jgi:hypothetical protein
MGPLFLGNVRATCHRRINTHRLLLESCSGQGVSALQTASCNTCANLFFYFFYIRIDPAESSTLEWLSSKLTESVSLMYVTGLLLYAAIISALVGYLGSGLAKSVISSTKVRISRKIYKTKLFCRGSSQSWWDVHLLPPESCLDIQGETGRLTKHQNQ